MNIKKIKTRKISIENRILRGALILGVSICIIMGVVFYFVIYNLLINYVGEKAIQLASIGSGLIDAEEHEKLKPGDEDSEAYKQIINDLSIIVENTEVFYVYTIRDLSEDKVQFVIDTDDSEEKALIGQEYDKIPGMQKALDGEANLDNELIRDEWGEYYSAYAPIRNSKGDVIGIVGIDYSVEFVNKRLNTILIYLSITLVLCILFSIAGAMTVSKKIGKNLAIVNHKIDEVAHSDGDLTQIIDVHSGDEMECIANNINDFLKTIRDIVNGIKNISATIHQETSEIEDNMGSLYRDFDVLENVSTNITDQIEQQAESIHTSTVLLSDISEHIDLMKKNTDNINQTTTDTTAIIVKGNESIRELSDVMDENQKSVEAVSIQSTELGEIMQNIVTIVTTIENISSQTNLLALNASIEAARAGESGRGFAVVADEIRKLATETAESASNIRKQIVQVDSKTKATVEAVTDVTEKMITQQKQFNGIKEILLKTMNAFTQIEEDVKVLYSTSVALQNKRTNLTKKMTELDGSVDEIVTVTESMKSAKTDQAKSLEVIRAGMENMKSQSDGLAVAVEKFKS